MTPGLLLQPDRFATLTRATVQRTAPARLPRWSRDRVIGRASGFDARTSAARRWSSARRCSSAERACARKLVRSEAILLLPQLPVTTVGSRRWIGRDRWDRRGGCEAMRREPENRRLGDSEENWEITREGNAGD